MWRAGHPHLTPTTPCGRSAPSILINKPHTASSTRAQQENNYQSLIVRFTVPLITATSPIINRAANKTCRPRLPTPALGVGTAARPLSPLLGRVGAGDPGQPLPGLQPALDGQQENEIGGHRGTQEGLPEGQPLSQRATRSWRGHQGLCPTSLALLSQATGSRECPETRWRRCRHEGHEQSQF